MKIFIHMFALALFTVCNTVTADILNLTVDKNGTVALGGTMLLISGTVTCDEPSGSIYSSTTLNVNIIQISVGGKVVSQAYAYGGVQCNGGGNPVPFTLQMIYNNSSPFKPGLATVTTVANQYVCDSNYNCASFVKNVSDKVRLNP